MGLNIRPKSKESLEGFDCKRKERALSDGTRRVGDSWKRIRR